MIRDAAATGAWRPQAFGRRPARRIDNPIIEPLWNGIRALAHVTATARLVDEAGDQVDMPDVAGALVEAIRASSLVLDGYLTAQVTGTGVGILTDTSYHTPTSGLVTRQMLLGGGAGVRQEMVRELSEPSPPVDLEGQVAFVAVDLLLLDDQPLLDVPLLERKRLLESVVEEGPLVRCGLHIAPPIDPWLATWRALGFRELAWKGANSRYRPGERNDDWATSILPQAR